MYEEIKKNLIDRFLSKQYLWTFCCNKLNLIEDINNRSPFDIVPSKSCDSIEMHLGDGVIIKFDLKWEDKMFSNSDIFGYRLVGIS